MNSTIFLNHSFELYEKQKHAGHTGEGEQVHRAQNGKAFQGKQFHRMEKAPSPTRQARLHIQKRKTDTLC